MFTAASHERSVYGVQDMIESLAGIPRALSWAGMPTPLRG